MRASPAHGYGAKAAWRLSRLDTPVATPLANPGQTIHDRAREDTRRCTATCNASQGTTQRVLRALLPIFRGAHFSKPGSPAAPARHQP